jgi:hypothetical protein
VGRECVEGLSGVEFSLHGDTVFTPLENGGDLAILFGCAMSLRHTCAARRVVAGSFWFIRVIRLAEVS